MKLRKDGVNKNSYLCIMPSTSAPTTNELGLPMAVIVCISVLCYTALVFGILLLRYAIRRHHLCQNCCKCNMCGSEEPLECACCAKVSESCSCDPSLNKCLDKMCPNRKHIACVDVLLCQCFAGPNNCCTNEGQEEEDIFCVCPYDVSCCNRCDLCCFEVSLRTTQSVREHRLGMSSSSARSVNTPKLPVKRPHSSTAVQVIKI